MSLTFGSGPFGTGGNGQFDFGALPRHVRYWEPWPRRMRAMLDGEILLDSRAGMLLHETGVFSQLYFPLADFRSDLLHESTSVGVPARQSWSTGSGAHLVERCITSSPFAADGSELLPGYATVGYASMDRWFEEDDPIYAHPRDPYHRVDVLSSSRAVVVRLGDTVIAQSRRPKLLFETGVPIRYYVPFDDVRLELLAKSDTISECPYKGDGQHWHLRVDGTEVPDAAWSLPHPLPEGLRAAEHVCFYPDKLQTEIDGERLKA